MRDETMFDGDETEGRNLSEEIAEEFDSYSEPDAYQSAVEEERETPEPGIDEWQDRRTLRGVPAEFAADWIEYLEDSENVF